MYSRLFFRFDRSSKNGARRTYHTRRNISKSVRDDAVGKNLPALTRTPITNGFPGTLADVVAAVAVMADRRHYTRLASFGICVATVSGAYEHSTSLYHFIYREQDFTVTAPRDPRRFHNIMAIFLDSRFTAAKRQARGRTSIALRNRAYRRCYLIVLRLVEPVT